MSTLPIIKQLALMRHTPLFDDTRDFSGKLALSNQTRFHLHQRFKSLVLRMDMNGRVVVMPHADDDAEKGGFEGGLHRPQARYTP